MDTPPKLSPRDNQLLYTQYDQMPIQSFDEAKKLLTIDEKNTLNDYIKNIFILLSYGMSGRQQRKIESEIKVHSPNKTLEFLRNIEARLLSNHNSVIICDSILNEKSDLYIQKLADQVEKIKEFTSKINKLQSAFNSMPLDANASLSSDSPILAVKNDYIGNQPYFGQILADSNKIIKKLSKTISLNIDYTKTDEELKKFTFIYQKEPNYFNTHVQLFKDRIFILMKTRDNLQIKLKEATDCDKIFKNFYEKLTEAIAEKASISCDPIKLPDSKYFMPKIRVENDWIEINKITDEIKPFALKLLKGVAFKLELIKEKTELDPQECFKETFLTTAYHFINYYNPIFSDKSEQENFILSNKIYVLNNKIHSKKTDFDTLKYRYEGKLGNAHQQTQSDFQLMEADAEAYNNTAKDQISIFQEMDELVQQIKERAELGEIDKFIPLLNMISHSVDIAPSQIDKDVDAYNKQTREYSDISKSNHKTIKNPSKNNEELTQSIEDFRYYFCYFCYLHRNGYADTYITQYTYFLPWYKAGYYNYLDTGKLKIPSPSQIAKGIGVPQVDPLDEQTQDDVDDIS